MFSTQDVSVVGSRLNTIKESRPYRDLNTVFILYKVHSPFTVYKEIIAVHSENHAKTNNTRIQYY